METTRRSGRPILGFLAGAGTMLLAGVAGASVLGYLIAQFYAGPHLPGEPIDKNVGLDAGLQGVAAANVLALATLAWFGVRRRQWPPLAGGLAVAAAELALFLWVVWTRSRAG